MTGFININKEQGVSSAKEVSRIKHLTGTPCGHMGTLDPMASGVLPIGVGNATRLFDYFLNKKKEYIAEFTFGQTSDTLDSTGNITYGGAIPTAQQIQSALPMFCGELDQMPPKYSAKSVNGKRGYELARQGIEFELQPKRVTVYGFELLKQTKDDAFEFKITCGGGTYIRSLARDLGEQLQTQALMSSLIRSKSGAFTIENSVRSEELTKENIQNYLIPTQDLLPFETFIPTPQQEKKLLNGIRIPCDLADGDYKFFTVNGEFYGIVSVQNATAKIRIKLC